MALPKQFMSYINIVTLFFHVLGIVSPHWMCAGDNCDLRGIYYKCVNNDCEFDVPNKVILILAVVVIISCTVLNVLHCDSNKDTSVIGLCWWYVITEILTAATLITIAMKFDIIGWSAYVFTVPGITGVLFVTPVVIYMHRDQSKAKHQVELDTKK